jgi:ABC-type branched-subunit amino acid transport system ATPase component
MPEAEALGVSGVTVRFGGLVALDDVNLSIPWGKVTALIGPNGAGKTTLFNVVSGFLRPTDGSVTFAEAQIVGARPATLARRGLVRSFQDVKLFTGMTVRENIQVALDATRGRGQSLNANYVLEVIGLRQAAEEMTGNLSYAEQKFVSFGRLMAAVPDVFLLDEPSSGLDVVSARRFADMLVSLVRPDTAVVLVEHNLDMVRRVADDAVFMNMGKVIAHGQVSDVLTNPQLIEIYLGVASSAGGSAGYE